MFWDWYKWPFELSIVPLQEMRGSFSDDDDDDDLNWKTIKSCDGGRVTERARHTVIRRLTVADRSRTGFRTHCWTCPGCDSLIQWMETRHTITATGQFNYWQLLAIIDESVRPILIMKLFSGNFRILHTWLSLATRPFYCSSISNSDNYRRPVAYNAGQRCCCILDNITMAYGIKVFTNAIMNNYVAYTTIIATWLHA